MDATSSIIHNHNPNKEGKHPHLIQKMSKSASHMLNGGKQDVPENPNLVPLIDWKPADIELFASMGFSAENAGDDGYYMEEDILPSGLGDEKKFTRRISRTKDHKWVLEKKSTTEPDSSYRLEKVYGHLMGTDKNPGLLDYFDTLTNELTENHYLYKGMKLKSILENLPISKQSPPQSDITAVSKHTVAETTHPEPGLSSESTSVPVVQRGLSKEQKKMLQELVYEYNKYNEVLEARKKLMEVAKKMGDIGDLSEAYLIEKLHEGNKDDNAWFEEKTIRRNTADIKKMTAEFKKMATDCDESMRKMQGLYQECGMMLERYFHME